ncbi:MAG: serine/threonine protein kinase [Chitinispirillaceae bacterium]
MIRPRLPKGFSSPVKIGSGGFGEVYRVRQDALDRFVALKFILEGDARARSVLKKEAAMQAGLHIRGIPQIYDVLEFSGHVCIVMQWINGCSIRDLLEQNLTYQNRLDISKEIIEICASLHQQGYAHRDIKPENFLVSGEGVFLIDFGLAYRIRTARRTSPNVLRGTLAYIAPELLKGQNLSADPKRADVYSIGKVIEEIFDGAPVPDCIRQCLCESPSFRPESAVQLLENCRNFFPEIETRWEDIAEPWASEKLAQNLLKTAENLIGQNRAQSAYPLLVECLQVYPELPGALELMENFPTLGKKKNPLRSRAVLAAGAGLLSVVISIAVVLAMKNKDSRYESDLFGVDLNSRTLKISGQRRPLPHDNSQLPLKEMPISPEELCGTLEIASHPPRGNLFVKGEKVASPGVLSFSVPVRDRAIYWKTSQGNIIWKEVVRVLPFQIKRLTIKERG